jgi:MSHA biogenesis protein MshQ
VTADPLISAFTGGVGTLTFSSGTGLLFTRGSAVTPFDADIALSFSLADGDGVVVGSIDGSAGANPVGFGAATAGNGILFSGTNAKRVRFGRLRLQNAAGSSALNLSMPLRTEYYQTGGYFVTNTDDGCTAINASDIRFDFPGSNLAACETRSSPTGAIAFTGGAANYRLTAPGVGNEGAVDLTVNLNGASGNACVSASSSAATNAARPWLQDSLGSGAYTDNPRGRATFGIYKGADEIIWLREMY